MIPEDLRSEIRRLFYVSHFSANAIASSLGIHRDAVIRALELKSGSRAAKASELDQFQQKIRETLEIYPKLHGSRIYMMLKDQGYTGSIRQLRRRLSFMRKPIQERFYVKPNYLPGECAQVDWGHFGTLVVGKAERKLSAFVMTLAWSRRMFVYFSFDQKIETLLACHQKAFLSLGGVPRSILYDNMKTVVRERLGQTIRYHESLQEFCQHWLFRPSVCAPYQPQSKGRVERSIRYFRGAFFEARPISDIETLNNEALKWCEMESLERRWPGDPSTTVSEAFAEEQKVLLPLPDPLPKPLPRKLTQKADRYGFVHFERNQYSVPPVAASELLTVWIYEDEVVINLRNDEIARHERSFDAGQKIEIDAHQAEIKAQRNRPRVSAALARLYEELPALPSLLQLWMEFQLDTKALLNFLTKAKALHGSDLINRVIGSAITDRASRVEDLSRYLYESMQDFEPNPPLKLTLPENPDVRDLSIRSHDLNTYDDL